jgi:hypothetical protein
MAIRGRDLGGDAKAELATRTAGEQGDTEEKKESFHGFAIACFDDDESIYIKRLVDGAPFTDCQ